ncbi:MAG TPA: hypothetical protein VM266_01600 [Solirubrobacteraceae bacterium]|nr:hypothetical protein [Solirubrobacteraceae bacterium]
MSRLRILVSAAAAAALATAALPALAAEPSSGTVSASSPTVEWTGQANGYGVVPTNILITATGEDPLCPPQPFCDKFALKVADSADLTVTAQQSAANNFTELHIIRPDGTVDYVQSEDAKPATLKIRRAPVGDYTIEVMTNETLAGTGDYHASAKLAVAQPAEPAPSDPSATPGQPGGDPQPGQPADPQPAASLSLKTKKLSARKARKAPKLRIAASKPVTDVEVQLLKGKKVVGKGSLARIDSVATVKLKSRKLRKGAYVVAVAAKDAETQQAVGTRAKLKVTR